MELQKDPKEKSRLPEGHHALQLSDRRALTMDGVEEVLLFDGDTVTLKTALGVLDVEGQGLTVECFDAKSGNLSLAGSVSALIYRSAKEKKRRLFGGLGG